MAKGMVMPDMNMNNGMMMSQKQNPSHGKWLSCPMMKCPMVPSAGCAVLSILNKMGCMSTNMAKSAPRKMSSESKRCGCEDWVVVSITIV